MGPVGNELRKALREEKKREVDVLESSEVEWWPLGSTSQHVLYSIQVLTLTNAGQRGGLVLPRLTCIG